MKYDNVFLQEPQDYKRNLDVITEATNQAAKFLSLRSGKPLDVCLDYVKKVTAKGGKFELTPVKVNILKRKENGDRCKVETDIDKFLKSVIKTNSVLSPNGVVYDNIEDRVSPNSVFIVERKGRRTGIKKDISLSENTTTIDQLTNEEKGIKLIINSGSGAAASNHNIFFAPTSHSSMTSGTRVATGYSNGSTESMICGNRHYWELKVVVNNILSVVSNIDKAAISKICEKYNLHLPSIDETLSLISYSTDLYFKNKYWDYEIKLLVEKMDGIERAAFCYIGDMFHFFKYNTSIMVSLFKEYINVRTFPVTDDHADKVNELDKEIHIRVKAILSDQIGGKTLDELKSNKKEVYNKYIRLALNIQEVNIRWEDLLVCFLGGQFLSPDVFNHWQSMRKAIPAGDTDSTMYTVQNWRELLKPYFNIEEYKKVRSILFFLNDLLVGHKLAMFCTNMGVHEKLLYDLKMKNEFAFPTFMCTTKTKHYAVKVSMKEGKLISPPKLDIKGVWLIDSKKPQEIGEMVREEINYILDTVDNDCKISIMDYSHRVANLEHLISTSILNGEKRFLFLDQIKTKDSYSNPNSSKWMYHDLWSKVFKDKYGDSGFLPYSTFKLSLDLNKKKQLKDWVGSLEPLQQEAFNGWLTKIETIEEEGEEDVEEGDVADEEKEPAVTKDKMSMILIPSDVCDTIPLEFIEVLDVRKMVAKMVAPFYLIFESLGYHYINGKYSRMVSDSLKYDEAYGLPGSLKFSVI